MGMQNTNQIDEAKCHFILGRRNCDGAVLEC